MDTTLTMSAFSDVSRANSHLAQHFIANFILLRKKHRSITLPCIIKYVMSFRSQILITKYK